VLNETNILKQTVDYRLEFTKQKALLTLGHCGSMRDFIPKFILQLSW
jgi:hypothetical protein